MGGRRRRGEGERADQKGPPLDRMLLMPRPDRSHPSSALPTHSSTPAARENSDPHPHPSAAHSCPSQATAGAQCWPRAGTSSVVPWDQAEAGLRLTMALLSLSPASPRSPLPRLFPWEPSLGIPPRPPRGDARRCLSWTVLPQVSHWRGSQPHVAPREFLKKG